jgi:hypothetical protein
MPSLERFFFHVNGKVDESGFMMHGPAAARRHAHAMKVANGSAPWSLTITNEDGESVPAGLLVMPDPIEPT